MSEHGIHHYLPEPDLIVLRNLFEDVDRALQADFDPGEDISNTTYDEAAADTAGHAAGQDEAAIERLKAYNNPDHPDFRPTVFVTWDDKHFPQFLNRCLIRPYARFASSIVRHPTDVVFLTHIILYFAVNLPSAVLLFRKFSWIHGIAHAAFTFWCTGSFTLMMHNHIHNNGILARSWYCLDLSFPYIFYPLFGHTWNSYYYHHVKHHHVEGNGPDDLSSTIRYQRDDIWHFLHYVGRFIFFVWLDLPLYFWRKNKRHLAISAFFWEAAGMAFLYAMTRLNARASVFVFLIPFALLRLGLMIGNWGQHALVDECEPDSDFRSSITLVDVPSNRFCFNDGYHTAHHLNPRRHWRDQPLHFLQSKAAYSEGRALVFHNIDYLMMTFKLMQKDYMHLASCVVPIGAQIGMTQAELAKMLRTKTRRFTEEEISSKFGENFARKPAKWYWHRSLDWVATTLPGAVHWALLAVGPTKVEAADHKKST